MRPDWWKYLLSHLSEIPVEKRESAFSGTLKVSLDKGEWKLSTENAIYSYGRCYTSYAIAFQRLDIRHRPINGMLMLGCGIGAVARLLEKHPHLNHVTALDIDPVIIDLAEKYWPEKLKDKTVFICSDAAKWIESVEGFSFDLIIADLFIDDVTPEEFLKADFLSSLKGLLSDAGMLLFSKINYTHPQRQANLAFEKTFKSVFKDGQMLPAGHNLIFVGKKENGA